MRMSVLGRLSAVVTAASLIFGGPLLSPQGAVATENSSEETQSVDVTDENHVFVDSQEEESVVEPEQKSAPEKPDTPSEEPQGNLIDTDIETSEPSRHNVTQDEETVASDPMIEVFFTDGVTPVGEDPVYDGDVLVVKGTGFEPGRNISSVRPPLPPNVPSGNYVVFGNFADQWRPSSEVQSDLRQIVSKKWALLHSTVEAVDPLFLPAIEKEWTQLQEDGSFEAELDVAAADTEPGTYGVFTYVAGGADNDAAQELEVRVNYQGERPDPAPKIQVFHEDGVTPVGEDPVYEDELLVVKGSGFAPENNIGTGRPPIPAGKPSGNYVVFGNFAEQWRPSEGVESKKRKVGIQKWALPQATLDSVDQRFLPGVEKDWVELNEDGSFVAELAVTPADTEPGSYGVFTYVAGGATDDPAQELEVRVNFHGEKPVTPPETNPEQPTVTEAGSLVWSFKSSWNMYVKNLANGTAQSFQGATKVRDFTFEFPQVAGGDFHSETQRGTIRYQGLVQYRSALHGFDIVLSDPWVEFDANTTRLTAEVSVQDTSGISNMKRVQVATLQSGEGVSEESGRMLWEKVPGTFSPALGPDGWKEYRSQTIDPVTFSFGAAAKVTDTSKPKVSKFDKSQKRVSVVTPIRKGSQTAGSLTWGVSTGFYDYTVGKISKGSVNRNGVGGGRGGFIFPQASGSWNEGTQTGTVQYSGVVTFRGHGGQMVETFANPTITVTNAQSGTLSAGGRTFALNLGAANKQLGSNGEVTWTGVPVSGMISGAGGGGGGSFPTDGLSFTVGAAGGALGGSASEGEAGDRIIPSEPPATTGVRMLTPANKIRPGATIELEAPGYATEEYGIHVVLYSEPLILDAEAEANQAGLVRWVGKIPEDVEPGEHTITVQGSADTGAVIEVLEPIPDTRLSLTTAPEATTTAGFSAETDASGGFTGSVVWIAAVMLLLAAGTVSGLSITQRVKRKTL